MLLSIMYAYMLQTCIAKQQVLVLFYTNLQNVSTYFLPNVKYLPDKISLMYSFYIYKCLFFQ